MRDEGFLSGLPLNGFAGVRYWQGLIYGTPGAYLDKILVAGFDGAYLDIIDVFAYFEARGE